MEGLVLRRIRGCFLRFYLPSVCTLGLPLLASCTHEGRLTTAYNESGDGPGPGNSLPHVRWGDWRKKWCHLPELGLLLGSWNLFSLHWTEEKTEAQRRARTCEAQQIQEARRSTRYLASPHLADTHLRPQVLNHSFLLPSSLPFPTIQPSWPFKLLASCSCSLWGSAVPSYLSCAPNLHPSPLYSGEDLNASVWIPTTHCASLFLPFQPHPSLQPFTSPTLLPRVVRQHFCRCWFCRQIPISSVSFTSCVALSMLLNFSGPLAHPM